MKKNKLKNMKHLKKFENYLIKEDVNTIVNKMDDIYNLVKETYPDDDWIDPKDGYITGGDWWNIVTDVDEWARDLETVLEEEVYGKVIDPNVEPEVEIYFQSEEESDCYVYTDQMGNVRSLFFSVD